MLLYIMEATNFRSEKQENPGNEERTPNAIGKFAYRRKDGIYVVPIGCLKNLELYNNDVLCSNKHLDIRII